MFLKYYGLQEQPFGVTPDPKYLYMSRVHREALASLVYGIETGLGFSTLIAEPGMGKTTLLNRILSHFRSSAKTAFIFETQCNSHELLRNLLLELEIGSADVDEDNVALLDRLKHYLLTQVRNHRRVLLVVDEAQNLSDSVLETIRLLSNFETFTTKLLHIVLAGQPQLANKLARREMAQLRQRINQANRLKPFDPEDSLNYVAHRLKLAGYSGSTLFTSEALRALVDRGRGIPRELNRLCFNALSLGCAMQKPIIDEAMMREVSADLDFGEETETVKSEFADVRAFRLGVEFNRGMASRATSEETIPASVGGISPIQQRTVLHEYALLAPEHRNSIRDRTRYSPPARFSPRAKGVQDIELLRFRPVPGTLTAKPVPTQEPMSAVTMPVSFGMLEQPCYQLRTRPRFAVIASVTLPILIGLWLWLDGGLDRTARFGSWLDELRSGPAATAPASQSDVQSDEMKEQQAESRAAGNNVAAENTTPVPKRRAEYKHR